MATFSRRELDGFLTQRNSLKALHGAGNRGGFRAFRRFRLAVLRRGGCRSDPWNLESTAIEPGDLWSASD